MTRWQWSSRIHQALALATLALLSHAAAGCPGGCQCTQPYYVYCQGLGLTAEGMATVVASVPYEAILLDLGANAVEQLASGSLDAVPNLEYLSLADNRVASVGLSAFHYLQRLKELDLRGNRLPEVGAGVFVNVPNLRQLRLDGNEVERVRDDAFSLPGLEELRLESNRLSFLGPSQLRGLPGLRLLDLSDNLLQALELGAFRDLTRLRTLRLSRNRLSSLAENAFEGLTSLTELHLDGNQLPSLDCFDVPNFADTLQRLLLTDNSLVAVPGDVFSRLRNLRTLALDRNRVAHVGRQAFLGLELDNLTLAHNLLEVVDRDMLDGTRRVSALDLSHNRIHTVKTGAFDSFRESVYVLNLAGNRLGALDRGMFRGMRNLQSLNLSSNAIWSVLDGSFRELTQLADLDLAGNELQWLSAGLLGGPVALRRLSVLDNPLRELRGFTFEDAAGHPVSILVNLTLRSSTATSVTVTWPYRQGAQLYWKLQTRPLSRSDPPCDNGSAALSAETSIPPNKISQTITGLRPGCQYFVCVNPAFLARDVEVLQCGVVSPRRLHAATTVAPPKQGSRTFNGGSPAHGEPGAGLCACVVLVLLVTVAKNVMCCCGAFSWVDAMLLILISWTKTRSLFSSDFSLSVRGR